MYVCGSVTRARKQADRKMVTVRARPTTCIEETQGNVQFPQAVLVMITRTRKRDTMMYTGR